MLRVDLHLHSEHSADSRLPLDELASTCRATGLDRIALTDHNTAAGAQLLARSYGPLAIVGEEVKTTEGEIIGLFLNSGVPAGLTPERTCELIRQMGGLTYAPHPFDSRRAHFAPERLASLASLIDIVEIYNQWCDRSANLAAAEFCREHGKIAATGSDAHAGRELGHSWMEMEEYEGPADFLIKLGRATHVVSAQSGRAPRAR